MSIALDGFEVFRQVGKHAEIFAAIRADVDQQARSLVAKCLKARSFGLGAFRDIRKALGQEQFGLALEGLKETELKSLLTRLDIAPSRYEGRRDRLATAAFERTGGWLI